MAKRHPGTALVAAYMTDFPTVYVDRPFSKWLGRPIGGAASRLCYRLLRAGSTAGSTRSMRSARMAARPSCARSACRTSTWFRWASSWANSRPTSAIPRCAAARPWRGQPLLIYVGRLDAEKRPQVVVEAFRRLPESLGAALLLLGDGPLREQFVGRGA